MRPILHRSLKFAAVLEVVALLVVANVLLWRIEAMLHFVDLGALLRRAATDGSGASTRGPYVATVMLVHLTLRGAIFFGVVFGFCWLRGYRDGFHFGLSTGGRKLLSLVLVGLLAYCVGQAPTQLLSAVIHLHLIPAGDGAQSYMFHRQTWSPAFWFVYTIALCVVVPLHEEFFFRGYAQRRLEVAFRSPGTAIVIGAVFFTLQHLSDYLYRLDARNVAELSCMAFDAIVIGYVFWRTRSLVPCVVSHALCNFPLRSHEVYMAIGVVMAVVLIATLRRWLPAARDLLAELQNVDPFGLMVATTLVSVCMFLFEAYSVNALWSVVVCGFLAVLCITGRWGRIAAHFRLNNLPNRAV